MYIRIILCTTSPVCRGQWDMGVWLEGKKRASGMASSILRYRGYTRGDTVIQIFIASSGARLLVSDCC